MSRGVPIELDDQNHRLYYGWNECVRIEESLGKKITRIDFESFRDLRVLVWAGLLRESHNLGLAEVGDMLDTVLQGGDRSLEELGERVMDAMVEGGIVPEPVDTHEMTVAEIEAAVEEWTAFELETALESEMGHPDHKGGRKGALEAIRGELGNA